MDPVSVVGTTGLKLLAQKSFSSIFDELRSKAEAFISEHKLLSASSEKYADYIVARIGVFPLYATNRQVSVEDTYTQVCISNDIEREKYKAASDIEAALRKQKSGVIQLATQNGTTLKPIEAIQSTSQGFALLGNPGSGKTTLFRHLTVQAAKGVAIRGMIRLPIYLAARDMARGVKSIEEAAINFLNWLDIKQADRVFNSLMLSGKSMLLLDGLDETGRDHQKQLLTELSNLQAKYPNSLICVSSRPFGLSVGFLGFTKWEIVPLSFDDRVSFVKKWFSVISPAKGEQLVDTCKDEPSLLDLGSNPLLLSIVCALYYNDLNIPSDPDELYGRSVEGVLGGWDAFRNIARETIFVNFSLHKRIILVKNLAATLFQQGKIVFSSKDVELSGCLKRASDTMRKEIPEASQVLEVLYNDFGLLVERSPGLYSFSHLTLQEYLTARYIVDNRMEINLLSSFSRKSDWREVVFLVGKMLSGADEYMRYLTNSTRPDFINEVSLLKAIWEIKPLCSPKVVQELMRVLLEKVTKTLWMIDSDFSIDESTLLIIPHRQSRYKSLVAEKKRAIRDFKNEKEQEDGESLAPGIRKTKRDKKILSTSSPWLLLMNCLEDLWQIIEDSGYSYRDLGFADYTLFQILEKKHPCKINSFSIEKPQESRTHKNYRQDKRKKDRW